MVIFLFLATLKSELAPLEDHSIITDCCDSA